MSGQDGHFANPNPTVECNDTHVLHMKIASQLEYYLSDHHLAEDGFLLKHVQKNRQGYVSLKLLTSFKKMKELTRDWRVTLAGARYSDRLEVNEEGTKVRRQQTVPKWLLTAPTSKLLLAWNLFGDTTADDILAQGPDSPRVLERTLKRFNAHGNVTSLRILRPDKELPLDLRRHAKRHSELGRRLCAVVEFDCLEGARKANTIMKKEQQLSDGKGLCVIPLGCPGSRASAPCKERTAEEGTNVLPEDVPEAKLSESNPRQKSVCVASSMEDSILEKSADAGKSCPRGPRRAQRHKALNNQSCERSSQALNFSEFRSRSGGVGRSRCSGDYVQENTISPWVQRRKVAAGTAHPEKLRRVSMAMSVLRQPLGPDNTTGFRGRGRPLLQ
ncbi:la-related protein 6-like [Aplochiton taeniatus]